MQLLQHTKPAGPPYRKLFSASLASGMTASDFCIPLITIPKNANNPIAADLLDLLRQACLDHGFFLLSNDDGHGYEHIGSEHIGQVWKAAEDLFDCPLEAKLAVSVASSTNNRGYFSSLDHTEFNKDPAGMRIRDNKEGFFLGSDTLISPGNRVPAGKEHCRAVLESYMAAGRAACVTVMRAIVQAGMLRAPASAPASASSLAAAAGDAAPAAAADGGGDAAAAGAGAGVGAAEGVDVSLADPDAFVSRYLSDPVYMLKVLKYPPTDGNTDAHTDYGCITLLLPGDRGLQVHVGGTWREVPYVPGAFVVNFGDLLQAWSGGAVRSTIHRVLYNSPAGAPRYSVPLFLHPNRGTVISGRDGERVDTYSYVLSRFDATYKHRQQQAAAAAVAATPAADAGTAALGGAVAGGGAA